MDLLKQLVLPSDWRKIRAKVTKIASNSDLIIEVVDCRIIDSTWNVLDYNSQELKNIPRVIYLSFEDLANQQITTKWRAYFKRLNFTVIPKNYFKEACITDLWTWLTKKRVLSTSITPDHGERIATLVGVGKAGKRELVKELNCQDRAVINKNDSLYSKVTKKSCQYNVASGIKVIDTVPVIPLKALTEPNIALNLHLFNKFALLKIGVISLATKAFVILFNKNHQILNKYYALNITPAQVKNKLTSEQISIYFEKIAVTRDLVNEFNNIEILQACELLCQEFANNTFSNLSLETPPV